MKTLLTLPIFILLPQPLAADVIPVKPFARGIIRLPQYPFSKTHKSKPSPLIVVRNAKEYAQFLDRIPKKQISKTRPAPLNTDPLLKRPRIDFQKHTLLVLTRPSMTRPKFTSVIGNSKSLDVSANFPRELPAARPIHIGTYTAVLIPQSSLPIRLKTTQP